MHDFAIAADGKATYAGEEWGRLMYGYDEFGAKLPELWFMVQYDAPDGGPGPELPIFAVKLADFYYFDDVLAKVRDRLHEWLQFNRALPGQED